MLTHYAKQIQEGNFDGITWEELNEGVGLEKK